MDIKYRHTVLKPRLKKLCKVAYRHRAYASWGMMQDWFQEPNTAKVIAVAYNRNDRIVAAAILMDDSYHREPCFGVYVKRRYRRKGIGKKLTKIVLRRFGEEFGVDRTEENFEFFDSVGLQ